MRVKQTGTRRPPPPTEAIRRLVEEATLSTNDEDMVAMLPCEEEEQGEDGRWHWPYEEKTDLLHWAPLLDRLDGLLEKWIGEYALASVQSRPFEPSVKSMIQRILGFARCLLENSAGRNLFSWYDRLDALLGTSDMGVLEKVLELLIIPARKYEEQRSLRANFCVSRAKLECIAGTLVSTNAATQKDRPFVERLLKESQRRHEAATDEAAKTQFQYIRLMAIAVSSLVTPDPSAISAFILYPNIIIETARLLSAQPKKHMKIETAALCAIRSFARLDTKDHELLYALNMSAGHGFTVTTLRILVSGLALDTPLPYPHAFTKSFIEFLHYLAPMETDELLISNNLFDIVLRGVETTQRRHFATLEQLLGTFATALRHHLNAVDPFFESGLPAVLHHIGVLIDLAVSHGDLQCYPRDLVALLETELKIFPPLLLSFGSANRLRNLVDTNMFKHLKMVFENHTRFGAECFTQASVIMATFIHNEPTSLTILQEHGVPQAFVDAINLDIPSHANLLSKLPHIFDAICLNAAGLAYFIENNPFGKVCAIFADESYTKSLQSHSTAMQLGQMTDELMRHHPRLRELLIEDVLGVIEKIRNTLARLGATSLPGCDIVQRPAEAMYEDVKMVESKENEAKRVEPQTVSMLEVYCIFIEGMCQSAQHARLFVDKGGIARISSLYMVPRAFPGDLSLFKGHVSTTHLFRRLGEEDAPGLIRALIKCINECGNTLDQLQPMGGAASFLVPCVDSEDTAKDGAASRQTALGICALSALSAYLNILASLYSSHATAFTRVVGPVLEEFARGEGADALEKVIGRFLEWAVNERNMFRKAFPPAWFDCADKLMVEKDPEVTIPKPKTADPDDYRVKNVRMLDGLLRALVDSSTNIFAGLAKLVSSRRSTLAEDGSAARELASKIAALLAEHASSWIGMLATSEREDDQWLASASTCLANLSSILFDGTADYGCASTNQSIETTYRIQANSSLLAEVVKNGALDQLQTFPARIFGAKEAIFRDPKYQETASEFALLIARLSHAPIYKDAHLPELQTGVRKIFEFVAEAVGRFFSSPDAMDMVGEEALQRMMLAAVNITGGPVKDAEAFDHILDVYEKFHVPKSEYGPLNDARARILGSLKPVFLRLQDKDATLFSMFVQLFQRSEPGLPLWLHAVEYEPLQCCSWKVSSVLRLLAMLATSPCRQKYLSEIVASWPMYMDMIEFPGNDDDREQTITAALLLSTQLIIHVQEPVVDQILPGENTHSGSLKATVLPQYDEQLIPRLFELATKALGEEKSWSIGVLHAILYCLAVITRRPTFASQLATLENVEGLIHASVRCADAKDRRNRQLPSLAMMIFRHMFETPPVLTASFTEELHARLGRDTRGCKIDRLLKDFDWMATRDPRVFVDILKRECGLKRLVGSVAAGEREIALKDLLGSRDSREGEHGDETDDDTAKVEVEHAEVEEDSRPDKAATVLVEETPSQAMKILLDSLVAILLKTDPLPRLGVPGEAMAASDTASHLHRCSALMYLTELLGSYRPALTYFLTGSNCEDTIKYLCTKTLVVANGNDAQERENEWTLMLVRVVCQGSMDPPVPGVDSQGLARRKTELLERCRKTIGLLADEFIKTTTAGAFSIREMAPRIQAYLEMMNALLSTKHIPAPAAALAARASPNSILSIAVVLLEHHVLPALTSVLKELDPRDESVSALVGEITLALELLSRLGNRLSNVSVASEVAAHAAANPAHQMAMDVDQSFSDYGYSSYTDDSDIDSDDDEEDEDDSGEHDTDDSDDSVDEDTLTETDLDDEMDTDSDDAENDHDDVMSYSDYSDGESESESDDESVRIVIQPPRNPRGTEGAIRFAEYVQEGMDEPLDDEGIEQLFNVPFRRGAIRSAGHPRHGEVTEEDFSSEEEEDYYGGYDEDEEEGDEGFDDEGYEEEGLEQSEFEYEVVNGNVNGDGDGNGFIERIPMLGATMRLDIAPAGHRRLRIRPARLAGRNNVFMPGVIDFDGANQDYARGARVSTEIYGHPMVTPAAAGAIGLNIVHNLELAPLLRGQSQLSLMISAAIRNEAGPRPAEGLATSSLSSAIQAQMSEQDIFEPSNVLRTQLRLRQEARLVYRERIREVSERLASAVFNALLPAAKAYWREQLYREAPQPDQVFGYRTERTADANLMDVDQTLSGEPIPYEQVGSRTVEREGSDENPESASESDASHPEHGADDSQQPSQAPVPTPIYEDPGVDPEFIEALPFDLRREVLGQHFAERRRLIPPDAEVRISPDFLQRLPTDAREDYERLSAEEIERYRRLRRGVAIFGSNVRHGRRAGNAETGRDIDLAQFIATLDPALRDSMLYNDFGLAFEDGGDEGAFEEEVMDGLDQRRGQLSIIAPELMADIGRINAAVGNVSIFGQAGTTSSASNPAPATAATTGSAAAPKKEPAPLVDGAALVAILKAYLAPIHPERRLHNRLLLNLCENGKTRSELLNILIIILEECPADVDALGSLLDGYVLDKTSGSGKSKAATPKATPKKKQSAVAAVSTVATAKASPITLTDPQSIPSSTIVLLQRVLQLLNHLASHSDKVRAYFITKCESPWTIKRWEGRNARKNATGFSSQTPMTPTTAASSRVTTTSFPIVVLLACLGNGTMIGVNILTELFLHLLSTVALPIKELVKEEQAWHDKHASASASAPAPAADHASSDPAQKATKEQKEPPQLPDIPPPFLHSLIKCLTTAELTSKALQYATNTFTSLAGISSLATALLSELSTSSTRTVDHVIRDLEMLWSSIKNDALGAGETLNEVASHSAAQSRLLRLMKMMTSIMFKNPVLLRTDDALVSSHADQLFTCSAETLEALKRELENAKWLGLWVELDRALGIMREDERMLFDPASLLPAIECFFIYIRQLSALSPPDTVAALTEQMTELADTHRKPINALIRHNPALLTSGSLCILTRIPKTLDFDNKRIFFKQQLHRKTPQINREFHASLNLNVRRDHVFEDSFHQIMSRSGDEVKYGRLNVKFHGEEGVDAGGVSREWFAVLSRQMFNPDYALFRTSAVDKITYQPNRTSYVNPDHLRYFTFIARILGKAIYDSKLLDCYFTRSFYKHILGAKVDFKDLEAIDPDYYKSLVWLVENDITDVFDLTFTAETDDFGTTRVVELKPDGANIAVTEDNKREYVRLVTEYRLTEAIRPQIEAFLRGFHEIIPANLISLFNEQELELLISGLPDIDVDDWKNNSEYVGYAASAPQIQWFWRAVRSFDQEERAKLVQFVTGTSKVPLEGFRAIQGSSGVQRFQIHRVYGNIERLPTAHTCFNQLDLPEYEGYEQLRIALLTAINECATGFGFV